MDNYALHVIIKMEKELAKDEACLIQGFLKDFIL